MSRPLWTSDLTNHRRHVRRFTNRDQLIDFTFAHMAPIWLPTVILRTPMLATRTRHAEHSKSHKYHGQYLRRPSAGNDDKQLKQTSRTIIP